MSKANENVTKPLERRVIAWLLSEDTGMSSQAICAHMVGERCTGDYPHDPSDLGRCVRLLELCPEWKARMPEMAQYGRGWGGLTAKWDEVLDLYFNEGGVPLEQRQRSPETYRAMKLAIADGYRSDERYTCTFSADGTLFSTQLKNPGDDDEELEETHLTT